MGLKGTCSFLASTAYGLLWWVNEEAQGRKMPDPLLEMFMFLGGQGELGGGGLPHGQQEHMCMFLVTTAATEPSLTMLPG